MRTQGCEETRASAWGGNKWGLTRSIGAVCPLMDFCAAPVPFVTRCESMFLRLVTFGVTVLFNSNRVCSGVVYSSCLCHWGEKTLSIYIHTEIVKWSLVYSIYAKQTKTNKHTTPVNVCHVDQRVLDLCRNSVPMLRHNLVFVVSSNAHTVHKYLCHSPTLTR